jgi:hypothetical protein
MPLYVQDLQKSPYRNTNTSTADRVLYTQEQTLAIMFIHTRPGSPDTGPGETKTTRFAFSDMLTKDDNQQSGECKDVEDLLSRMTIQLSACNFTLTP